MKRTEGQRGCGRFCVGKSTQDQKTPTAFNKQRGGNVGDLSRVCKLLISLRYHNEVQSTSWNIAPASHSNSATCRLSVRGDWFGGSACETDCREGQLMSVFGCRYALLRCSFAHSAFARRSPNRMPNRMKIILTGDTTETLYPINDFRTSTKSTLPMSPN
jgi:hypothetical protein